jgi:hypothetical protein
VDRLRYAGVVSSYTGDGDPGWYSHPPGAVANTASVADLARDGIAVD